MMTKAERKLLLYLAYREKTFLQGNILILNGHPSPDTILIDRFNKEIKNLNRLTQDVVDEQDKSAT